MLADASVKSMRGFETPAANDHVVIRGRTLDLNDLFCARLGEAQISAMAQQLRTAAPYPHLVVEGWFNPTLLELVAEEFDLYSHADMGLKRSRHEHTRRLASGGRLGPASTLYFALVNGGAFTDLLVQITGVRNLVVDAGLHGGGLHETRNGGKFGIHRDFDRHPDTRLENRMVFITYLNREWQPEWNGGLELWDTESKSCVRKIEPEFGRTVLMFSGHGNFHGHPLPLNVPAGIARRSIAAYYYTNTYPTTDPNPKIGSVYISPDWIDRSKDVVRSLVPPVLWQLGKRLARRA